jgi:hypothetical protein
MENANFIMTDAQKEDREMRHFEMDTYSQKLWGEGEL